MSLIYPFITHEVPELAQVGGKAMSLISMTRHGLPVPAGFVLTVAFFQPWLEYIRATPEWPQVLRSSPEELKRRYDALKARCSGLTLDEVRQQALAEALAALRAAGGTHLLAVRSSSPEEDLEELSFAGGYETVLGVTEGGLEEAVRRSFASCLDERVLVYKQEHGLAVDQPRIAVIVQQQIAAEAAGVAFSLNPLNNCYDEAVINANFGLGESVVSGAVSPDTFVVDKVSHTILERRAGKKETSIWLAGDACTEPCPERSRRGSRSGGTYASPSPNRQQFCLTDAQALQVADVAARVEGFYGKPMDIEWAFSGGQLVLLQARPITAYVPLPEALLTPPGAQKSLYQDMTLTKWGMPQPMSAMGTDYIAVENVAILRMTMGNITPEVANLLRPILEGRAYVNTSITIKMQGKKRVADEFRTMDTLSAEVIENLDETEYVPPRLPPELKGILFKVVRQNLGLLGQMLQALRRPDVSGQQYLEAVQRLPGDLTAIAREASSIRGLADSMARRMLADTSLFLAIIFAAEIAKSQIRRLFKHDSPEVRERVAHLERALPHNVTIDMGLAMDRLARFDEIRACGSGAEFAARLSTRDLSPEFLRAWDSFMDEYGFRCPMEMDPATPRPYERPARFFEQLRAMATNVDQNHDPQAAYQRVRAERERAYAELLQIARRRGRRQARQLEHNYRILVELGGLRETPKYCAILLTDVFRRRVLQAAQTLVEAGRLDDVQQVFDLTMDDLDRALADPTLDLRALAEKNTRFLRKLKRVREFPRVVDSRGKIFRAPRREAREGELAGQPISPGVVRGPVKVLHAPDEKPLLPGDVMVTRATDPGWTPLFINASGIILEVGGLLQHGALVAREYGKPCVAGIENVTGILRDGQMVEMDGARGIVQIL